VTINGKELARTEEGKFVISVDSLKGAPKNKPVCVDVLMG